MAKPEKQKRKASSGSIAGFHCIFAFLLLLSATALFLCRPAAADPPAPKMEIPINPSAWKKLILNITPFGIDITILVRTEQNATERFARVYMEFFDNSRIYQHAVFQMPFPIEYRSYSRDDKVVIHDLTTGFFICVPIRLSPISIFSLEESAATFFSNVHFEDIEPEIFEKQETFVLKISIDPIEISPGMTLSDIKGHLWVDSQNSRPVKLVVMGTAQLLSNERSPVSLLIDFRYSNLTLAGEDWEILDEAIEAFVAEDEEKGKPLIMKVEEGHPKSKSSYRKRKKKK